MPQQDPIDSITTALRTALNGMGIQNIIKGYPDSKFFEVDGRLPSLFVLDISDSAKHITSTETVHASVTNTDGTITVYKEKLRLTYLLQLSLFTNAKQTISSIGWQVISFFASNPQLVLDSNGVETAVFKYKGQHNPPGETNFYQRDMTYEVTARVLSQQTTGPATLTINPTISTNS